MGSKTKVIVKQKKKKTIQSSLHVHFTILRNTDSSRLDVVMNDIKYKYFAHLATTNEPPTYQGVVYNRLLERSERTNQHNRESRCRERSRFLFLEKNGMSDNFFLICFY